MTDVHHYGDWYVAGEFAQRTTIHGSDTVDVVVDPKTHKVTQVWYRCLNLPFTVSEREAGEINPNVGITAIEYVDKV